MFKHKAHSSGLVSHWTPFMKILNLTTNNAALLLRLLLLCVFSVLFHFNINSEGPLAVFFLLWIDFCSFCLRKLSAPAGRLSDPPLPLNPCFCHAKLTTTLWVNAACKCWDERGVSDGGGTTTTTTSEEGSTPVPLRGSAGPWRCRNRPNRNIFCLKMTILSIWERSASVWCFI